MFRSAWSHLLSWRWRTRYLWSQVLNSASCDARETDGSGTHCFRARWSQLQGAGRTEPGLYCGDWLKMCNALGFVLSDVLAVASQDRILSVFSSCGRRLLPAIQLATPVSALHCSTHFVMVLTAGATLSVWSVASCFIINVMWLIVPKLQIGGYSVKSAQIIYLIMSFQILTY